MTIGEQRRFECSLTVEERRKLEITLLTRGMERLVFPADDVMRGIADSLVKRGLLNEMAGAYHTTERGKLAIGRGDYDRI